MICFFTSFLTWKNKGFEERSNKQNMQKTTKTHKKRFFLTFCTCTNDTFGSSTVAHSIKTQKRKRHAIKAHGKKMAKRLYQLYLDAFLYLTNLASQVDL